MKDITKLKLWPELKQLGFIPITFRAHGKVVAIGAALQIHGIAIDGSKFASDIICIEPHSFNYSHKSYHITGDVNTPFIEERYQYDNIGRKEKIYQRVERINEFYKAADILPIINKMLS